MDLPTDKIGDATVVTICADHLDAGNVEEFKRDVAPVLESSARIALDMSQLQFLDSAGIGALLGCTRRLGASGGQLRLFGLTKPVRAAIDLARMHRIFDMFETKDQAVGSFTQ